MKIIFLSLLTLVLISCGEIRLEIGGNDSNPQPVEINEVGEWIWHPLPTLPVFGGYLVNSRTGRMFDCERSSRSETLTCTEVYAGVESTGDQFVLTAEDVEGINRRWGGSNEERSVLTPEELEQARAIQEEYADRAAAQEDQ